MNRLSTTLLLIFCLGTPGVANNLILAPTGTTLTTGQFRAEVATSVDGSDARYYWLGGGLQQFELNATRLQKPGHDAEDVIGVQWSFLPETMITPAVAFGVRDVADRSPEGIGPYVAVTRHIAMGPASIFVKDFAVTTGFGAWGIRGAFCGFQAELPGHIFLQGEFDSRDLNASIGWQPIKLLRLKAYTIRSDYFVGAELVPVTF